MARSARSNTWEYTIVDVAADSTTVTSKPAYLKAIIVNTALSAHALPIYDGTTVVYTLAASSAALTRAELDGIRMKSSIIVDPNDSATGNITVIWAPA